MKIKKSYSELRHHKTVLFILTWLAAAPLVTSSFATLLIIQNESWVSSFGVLEWVLFFAVSVFTMALAMTPTTFIAIVSGYFLGFDGAWMVVFSYQMASVLGYFLTKIIDRGLLDKLIDQYPRSERILENVEKKEFLVAILARLSPALPFAMMNVVLSVSKLRFVNFFFGGLIGMLPRTLFFIWVGSQADYLKNAMTQNEGMAWVVGITILVFLLFYFILKPTRQKTPLSED